ncbi:MULTISPECIES: hypothetical protein [Cyanophyceae]|jgi:hypothetical protein|uniref:ATP-binding protein n=2 Tax=Cyanophyceae TaxID=3028117 RepID=A0ABR8A3U9_9CYAN|nr:MULTISPECIES: hypothetical protein [Cyanophyceae]MBD2190047.1 hypothetical protein [Pseudanabaena mucicola FACHB-723]MBD2318668.1 hypothetical protein [Phormidium tenue FACHB-1050]
MILNKNNISIPELKTEIQSVIDNINDDKSNVFEHIRKKSLLSKLSRLNEISNILNIEKYKIVFIGKIGAGKTTAICHLFNLVQAIDKNIETKKGKVSIKVVEPLLSTASGRTTISEVIIKSAKNIYIEIDPYDREKLELLINDFCDSFYCEKSNNDVISTEMERALRSITKLNKITKKIKEEDGKITSKTVDLAEEKAKEVSLEEFKRYAFENADLDKRCYDRVNSLIFCPEVVDPKQWLKETFDKVNKADIPSLSIPKTIFIYINNQIFGLSELDGFDSVIDTKGIDESPIRADLLDYIEREDVICLFTSTYSDSPETNVRELMKYFLSQHSKKYENRFVSFVMPRKGEPEKENDGDGTREVGIEIKKGIVQSVFDRLNLNFLKDNILFYDALQCYDEKGRIERDYDEQDVQDMKNEVVFAINYVIENRKDTLINEVCEIRNSFQQMQEGKTLSEQEVALIEIAVAKLKDVQSLDKRIPSFIYEEFIDKYVEYYSENYKAWNTKDAIHRRFGTFEERGFDTFFDAKIVAEGLDENEMLKKFTRNLKNDVEQIINELGESLKEIDSLTPEIKRQFEIQYDAFVSRVGRQIEGFLRSNNENQIFWAELIDRRGKGAGYNQDVCTILRRKLEILDTGVSASRLLQEYSEREWKNTIQIILDFFVSK